MLIGIESLVPNYPTTIIEGGTADLIISNGRIYDDINVTVNGADYEESYLENGDYKIKIKNPKSNVSIEINLMECCFVARTPVLMSDGTTKNIEDVKLEIL